MAGSAASTSSTACLCLVLVAFLAGSDSREACAVFKAEGVVLSSLRLRVVGGVVGYLQRLLRHRRGSRARGRGGKTMGVTVPLCGESQRVCGESESRR